jgi:hypothetical protein
VKRRLTPPRRKSDLLHRDARVVVQDGPRHAVKISECLVVSFEESLGVLGRKGDHEAVVRVRQIDALEVRLLLDSCDHYQRFTALLMVRVLRESANSIRAEGDEYQLCNCGVVYNRLRPGRKTEPGF